LVCRRCKRITDMGGIEIKSGRGRIDRRGRLDEDEEAVGLARRSSGVGAGFGGSVGTGLGRRKSKEKAGIEGRTDGLFGSDGVGVAGPSRPAG
jgi:hypothetical protein